MYNLVIIVILVLLLFFLSHDKKFGKLFTKNNSLQIITGIIIAYFSLNRINFGILLIITILLILRYSYINSNVLKPIKDKYKTPLIKDIHSIIEKFGDYDDEDNDYEDNDYKNNNYDKNKREYLFEDIKEQTDELKMIFDNLDKKMNSMINK